MKDLSATAGRGSKTDSQFGHKNTTQNSQTRLTWAVTFSKALVTNCEEEFSFIFQSLIFYRVIKHLDTL